MRNEINLTDDQIEEKIEFHAGCCVEDLVFTRDTLEEFTNNANGWNQSAGFEDFEGGLYWSKAQARKGDVSGSLAVYDFGAVRAVYHSGTGI